MKRHVRRISRLLQLPPFWTHSRWHYNGSVGAVKSCKLSANQPRSAVMVPSRTAERTPTEAEVTFLPDSAINTAAAETVRLFNVALETSICVLTKVARRSHTNACICLYLYTHTHRKPIWIAEIYILKSCTFIYQAMLQSNAFFFCSITNQLPLSWDKSGKRLLLRRRWRRSDCKHGCC